jgi:hypothetical protein
MCAIRGFLNERRAAKGFNQQDRQWETPLTRRDADDSIKADERGRASSTAVVSHE